MTDSPTDSPIFRLDREPCDRIEQTVVNGFSQVSTIDEIWMRLGRPARPDGMPKPLWFQLQEADVYTIHLGFRILDQAGRTMADSVESEFLQRMAPERFEFEVKHIAAGTIPAGVPARIWKRPPLIWTPGSGARA